MQLLEAIKYDHDAIGALERIHDTPIPAAYDAFIRLITWLFGLVLLLHFHHEHETWIGSALFLGYLLAERIGAYAEGPFNHDGNPFCLPLNSICSVITNDLMQRDLEFSSFHPSRDPTSWD